ncbi:MAG: NAD(P)H-hydrate dehydratase [Eubacteriales bacterium]|nr:NAD(P)H-hydrate dehydratase [Eubacteriales bacterium]
MEYEYRPEDLSAVLPPRRAASHKGTYGRVLVAAGSKNMCGAAYLSAKAAYRTGAGLVYIYTEECNRVILQQLLPEAVLITYEPENWSREALKEALKEKDALVAGPGFGTGPGKKEILEALLGAAEIPCVLDADALNLLADDTGMLKKAKGPVIVTPHPGEMKRLSGVPPASIKEYPAQTALAFSRAWGVVTVLKNERTVVSNGTDCSFNTSGNHGMATAGSGDVLSGVIGALLAQKMTAFEAAKLGVYIHGLAGDAARAERGAYSMMAGDILEHILYKTDSRDMA